MSLYSEFMALRKKQQEEEAKKTGGKVTSTQKSSESVAPVKTKSSGSSLYDEFMTLRAAQAVEEDIAPVSSRVKNRITVGDLAPTKKKERTWFQKGALDDGFSLKNVTKTILGTGADLVEDIGTGVIGMGEKIVDTFATIAPYVEQAQFLQNGGYYNPELQKQHDKAVEESKKQLTKFVEKDLYDEGKVAKKIVDGITFGYDYEADSMFGEKSDSVIQSGGQLLATMGLQAVGVPWFLTTGATAFGGEAENAFNEGATYEEAVLSSTIAAGAEMLTEKLSGGIKFGGKALDDVLTDQIARGISKKFVRKLAKFGLDAFGEGAEEWITEDLNIFGQWLTYRDEEELKELLFSEAAMDEKIEAFIGGAALGGVSNVGNAIKSEIKGIDSVSGRTKNEEAVVNKIYEDLVAEAEQDGKVSAKQKSKIYDRVTRELEKGGISTDTIEELLDEEGYKAFQAEKDNFFKSDIKKTYDDALKSEAEQLKQLKEQLDKLNDAPNTVGNNRQYDSIVSQITELENNPQSAAIKAQLDQEVKRINAVHNELRTKVHNMVKGTKLEESYNELIRSNEKYTVDVEKYTNEHARKTIENILKSGMGDNTNHFHEYADWLAQISADKGMSFSLTNNEALKGTEHDFSAEGKIANGFVTEDGITLNMDSPKALNSTVGHEITHVLEQNAELYQTLQDTVFNYEIAKNGQEAFDKRLNDTVKRYKGKDADAKAELTADLIGDYLFTDYDFAHNLSVENRNIFEKIYDEIKYLCKVVTAGSKEARELEKVKKAFDDAYRANVKGKPVTKTQHSLGYHAGDLGKSEGYHMQGGDRSTGHFGTGTYFVSNPKAIEGYNTRGGKPAPVETVDLDDYNLYRVYDDEVGLKLHKNLHVLDGGFTQDFLDAAKRNNYRASELYRKANELADSYDNEVWNEDLEDFYSEDYFGAHIRAYTETLQENGAEFQTFEEWYNEYSGEAPTEETYEDYKIDYYDYLKETLEKADEERNEGYPAFRDAYFELWLRFGKKKTDAALQNVVDHINKLNPNGEYDYDLRYQQDSNATVFMKSLGYEGINVSGTKLDNTTYGSVIYDLKGKDLARKKEIGTAKYSLSKADETYFDAVVNRDWETAERMVDEAAKKAGYTKAVYHGTDARFTVFDTDEESTAREEHAWMADYPSGTIFLAEDYEVADGYGERVMPLYLDTTDMKVFEEPDMYAHRAMDDMYGYEVYNYPVIAVKGKDMTIYATLDNTLVKSSDTVTFGDGGEIIPLSERFKHSNEDIRYSLSDTNGRELTKEQQDFFSEAKTRDEQGRLKPFFHGTARADRVGNVFDPTRATSGPMAFFTDNRQVADNYARDKEDTSLAYDEAYDDYYTQFRIDVNGKNMSVSEAWKYLPLAKKNEIRQKAKHITMDDDYENVIYDEDAQYGVGGFDAYTINMHKGNILEALTDSWLESGTIYGEEQLFLDVLKMVGLDNVQYMNPDFRAEKTYEVYLNITNPFDTSNISEEMVQAFREAAEEAEYVEGNAADSWDKRNIEPERWIARLEDDIKNGTTHVWTSIPDFVTDVLKAKGYDGIFDTGGKGGGVGHTVAIPFYSEQIKNVDNQNPTTDKDIRYSVSKTGEKPKQYGNWNVYGSDFGYKGDFAPVIPTPNRQSLLPGERHNVAEMFPDEPDVSQAEYDNLVEVKNALESRMQELASGADFNNPEIVSEFEKVNADWVEASNRLLELDNELSDSDRVDSLMDADAPPEIDAPYYESEPTTLTKKATADIVRDVRTSLSLNNQQIADAKDIIEQYRTGKIQSREALVDALQDKFGSYTETTVDERLQELKREIRTRRLNVSDTIKHGIADYVDVMRHNRGKIRFSKEGLGVDELYKELQEDFKDYFNEYEQLSPENMFRQIVDIVNTPHVEEVQRTKDIENIEEAADLIINGIGDFKRNQDLDLSNRESKQAFESLVRQGDKYAPMDDIAPVKPVAPAAKTKAKPVAKTQAKQNPQVAKVHTVEPKTQKRTNKAWSLFKEHVLDKGMVFEDLSKKTGNRKLEAKWNFIRNSGARAQRLIGKGANGVKALTDIRKTVEKSGKTDKFFDYLYHVHNIDRMTLADRFKGTPNKAVFGDTITADISRQEAARLLKQNPEFKQWSQDVYKFNKHLRKLLVDGGVISQEVANLWEKMYPHYIPIRRDGDTGLNVNVPLDTNKTGINAPVKRATGGSRDILPLFDTMAMRAEQTYRAIAKNNFGIELKNILGSTIANEAQTVDGVIDSLDSDDALLKPGANGMNPTFTVFENGERVEFEITDEMYNAMKPTNDFFASTSKVLNGISNFRRGTLTEYNPWFMLKNAIKDQQDIIINSQHPVKTYANIFTAIGEMASGGEYYQEYLENGGEQNTYFDTESNTFEENKVWEAVKWATGLNEIAWANNKIEMLPRLAEYIASRKEGRSVEVSMLDAARVTTNFAAGGDITKWANRNGVTFLNASVQGAIQQARNVREAKQNGVKGVLGLAAKYLVAGLPCVLLNNLIWEDDEEYEELADYVKRDYYIVGRYGDGKFVRIPRGRTVAVLQYAFSRMDDVRTGDDEADMKTFLDIAWDTLMLAKDNVAPNNPLDNNVISPITQVLKNKTWYGEDLIPSRLQDVPAAEQFDESTDDISRWLGEKTNTSPMKWNYLLDQYSGVLGDTFLPMLTPEAESGDDTTFGTMTAPLRDMFTTDSVINNQISGDFYDTKDLVDIAANSSKATDEDKMKSTYMQAVGWELSDLYAQKRELQNSNMADSIKYKQSRDIQKQINEIMEDAMGGYEDVSIDGLYSEVGNKRFNQDAESGKWYEIKPKNADGSDNWYYQMEQDVTKALGISYGEYWNNREEYNYAYEKPEQYALSKAVGGYEAYRSYTSTLYDFKADYDENGKAISGSKKAKVKDYIFNDLDIDYGEKLILYRSQYDSQADKDAYNYDIIMYLCSRDDISYQEMEKILKYLDFKIDSNGNITW